MATKKEAAVAAPAGAAPAAPAAGAAAAALAKGSKKKLIIIAGAVSAVLLIGGGSAAWMLTSKAPDSTAEGNAKRSGPKKMPVFVDLDTFIVNLRDKEESERFMQVKLVAEVKDNAAGEMMKTLMPSLRNEILLLLGSKKVEDISDREGKEKLAGEIVMAANKILEGTSAEKAVEGVNFTHLIIQ
jgi:flagellar protein FliL